MKEKKKKTEEQENAEILLSQCKEAFHIYKTIEELKYSLRQRLTNKKWYIGDRLKKIFEALETAERQEEKKWKNYHNKEAFNECWRCCEGMSCLSCKHFVNTESSQYGIRGICKKIKPKPHSYYGYPDGHQIGWPHNNKDWCDKWQ